MTSREESVLQKNKVFSKLLDQKGTQILLKFSTRAQLHILHFFDTGQNAGFYQYKRDTNWL